MVVGYLHFNLSPRSNHPCYLGFLYYFAEVKVPSSPRVVVPPHLVTRVSGGSAMLKLTRGHRELLCGEACCIFGFSLYLRSASLVPSLSGMSFVLTFFFTFQQPFFLATFLTHFLLFCLLVSVLLRRFYLSKST